MGVTSRKYVVRLLLNLYRGKNNQFAQKYRHHDCGDDSSEQEDWTTADAEDANRTISFVSRMKGAEQGKPASEGCPSKRDISLKNWAYDPSK